VACTPGYFLIELSIRTADEIRRHIVKRGKRNPISRHYHKKEDKKAITTWKLDLNGILHVFNVCSVTSVWRLLTFRFQTELGMNAHPTVSDSRQDAARKHTTVSDVSGVDRNKMKGREGVDGQNQAVSTTRTLPVTE
jgi:hypothetical protein